MRLALGLFLLGLGLIVDAFSQVKRFLQGGFLDHEVRDMVLTAIWKFTLGFIIVLGLIYLLTKLIE